MTSFLPIAETSHQLPYIQLGERSSFEVELPHGFEIKNLAQPDHKCVATPDGDHLDVVDVVKRVHQGADGFRVIPPEQGNNGAGSN